MKYSLEEINLKIKEQMKEQRRAQAEERLKHREEARRQKLIELKQINKRSRSVAKKQPVSIQFFIFRCT